MKRAARHFAGAVALGWLLGLVPAVSAKEDPFNMPGAAPAEPKSYVNQYFIVGGMIAAGAFLVGRSSKRATEIPESFVVTSAGKDSKQI